MLNHPVGQAVGACIQNYIQEDEELEQELESDAKFHGLQNIIYAYLNGLVRYFQISFMCVCVHVYSASDLLQEHRRTRVHESE